MTDNNDVSPGGIALLRGLVLSCAVVAAALFAIAASAYPGGNHFDHHAVGHDFWKNALCDVARGTAVGGAPNATGAAFARASMSTMAVGIGALFWLLAESFGSAPRLALAVRSLAMVTVPAAIAVVFLPTDRFSDLHGVAVVTAGGFGLAAAIVAILGILRSRRPRERFIAALGILTLLTAATALAIYVDELVFGGAPRPLVPVFEHIAALLLLAWMITVGFGAFTSATSCRRRASRASG
jgi:hypothetical protein